MLGWSRPRAEGELQNPPGPMSDYWYRPVYSNAAGYPVSADGAMRIAVAFRCVSLIAGALSSVPCVLFRKNSRWLERATDHWLYPLLHDQPNQRQTSQAWRETLFVHELLQGRARNRILWNARGTADGLDLLNPAKVRAEWLPNGAVRFNWKRDDNVEQMLPQGDVLRVDGLSLDGKEGLSVIEYHQSTLGIKAAQGNYYGNFIRNGARPGGLIEYDGIWRTQLEHDEFVERWQKAQTGNNFNKTAMLKKGMKYVPVEMKHTDAQFLDMCKMSTGEICVVFGVPAHKVGILDRATLNNIEEQGLEFWRDTLLTHARRLEDSIKRDLIMEDDVYCKLLLDGLLRGSTAARTVYYQRGVLTGYLTRNEVREMEDLNPIEGLDEPLQPVNMETQDQAANAPDAGGQGGQGGDQQQEPPPDGDSPQTAQAPNGYENPSPALPSKTREGSTAKATATAPIPEPGRAAQRAAQILRGAAERAVTRERGELVKLAKRTANDGPAFRAGLTAFYEGHAEYLARGLQLPLERVAPYCRQRETAVDQFGLDSNALLPNAALIETLMKLALEA